MKPDVRKVASGKTMRVATVFTGAVACMAAGTPGAVAASGHHYRLDGTATGRGPHGGILVALPNSTEVKSCAHNPLWVHIKFSKGTECFGYKGTWNFLSAHARSICGGNNSGWIWNTNLDSTHFGRGNTYVHFPWPGSTKLSFMSISKSQTGNTVGC